jgi:hypothetical protein
MKPRIFLGSSAQQEKLLRRSPGASDIADVDAWTTVVKPGCLDSAGSSSSPREIDFAAFVFAQDGLDDEVSVA